MKGDAGRKGRTKEWMIIALAILAVVGLYALFGCPIRYITGFGCPGCGMTRAAYETLRLDFAAAFHYHPLLWLVPVGGWLVFAPWARARPKLRVAGLVLFCGVFIITWLLRWLVFKNPVVTPGTPGLWQDVTTGFARLKWWG